MECRWDDVIWCVAQFCATMCMTGILLRMESLHDWQMARINGHFCRFKICECRNKRMCQPVTPDERRIVIRSISSINSFMCTVSALLTIFSLNNFSIPSAVTHSALMCPFRRRTTFFSSLLYWEEGERRRQVEGKWTGEMFVWMRGKG